MLIDKGATNQSLIHPIVLWDNSNISLEYVRSPASSGLLSPESL